jgi:arylsulfatase A-like enzyme
MSKKNIVFILTDDLGYGDCSCYGQKTWQTPNIDKLAEEGIRFTDFYTTSPVCSPARASILTGYHSGHCDIRKLFDEYLPDDMVTVPKLLRKAGYVSACIGKYGVGRGMPDVDPLRKGFDYYYGYNCMRHAHNYFPPFLRENGLKVKLRNKPPEGDTRQWESGVGVAEKKVDYSPDFIEERALEFIEDCKDRPFFLYYCPTMPHANNEGKDTSDGMEVDSYGEFDAYDWRPHEKGFARMVQRIDETVGKIAAKLKELNLAEDTLLVFSSDNGPHNEGGHAVTRFDSAGGFQGYKRSLHEGGIRIPFIVWAPGTATPGVSDHMGYFPDLLATFCEAASFSPESTNDGISFYPVITGREDQQKKHEYLYFEFKDQLSVRKGNWKYYASDQEEGLYDLDKDRHEDNDLKAEKNVVLAEMHEIISREHRDYKPLPAPPKYEPRFHLNIPVEDCKK